MQGEYTEMEIEPSIGAPSGSSGCGGAGSGGPDAAAGGGGGVGGAWDAGTQTRLPSGWPQTCHLVGMIPVQRRGGGGAAATETGERTGEGKNFEMGAEEW